MIISKIKNIEDLIGLLDVDYILSKHEKALLFQIYVETHKLYLNKANCIIQRNDLLYFVMPINRVFKDIKSEKDHDIIKETLTSLRQRDVKKDRNTIYGIIERISFEYSKNMFFELHPEVHKIFKTTF